MARTLLPTLLVATLWSWPSFALSNNSIEIDIISPAAGGHYRINPSRGLAVVVAVQNKRATDRYGWSFSYQIRSVTNSTADTAAWPGQSAYFVLGGIGGGFQGIEPNFTIQNDEHLYIGLTHDYLFDGKPYQPMLSGEYMLRWEVKTGPTCYFGENSTSLNAVGDYFGEGLVAFTVADDAPWPELQPTPCASVAGQVSFSATGAYISNWISPVGTYQPLPCGVTEKVTESPDPCRATVGPEQARSISSIMTWVEGPPRVTAPPVATGADNATKPSLGSYLQPGFGEWFMLWGLMQGLGIIL